jgi:predicted metalloprotease
MKLDDSRRGFESGKIDNCDTFRTADRFRARVPP